MQASAWQANYSGLDVSEAKRLRWLEAENAKLKRLLAEAMLDNAALKDLVGKKVVTPAGRREAETLLQATSALSERRACGVLGTDRSSVRYRSTLFRSLAHARPQGPALDLRRRPQHGPEQRGERKIAPPSGSA